MLLEVKIDSKVLDDFAEVLEYYSSISEMLGENFHFTFLNALHKISLNPQHYFNISKKLRRITLKRFPYMIVYEVTESSVIVRALFHHSANPAKLRKW